MNFAYSTRTHHSASSPSSSSVPSASLKRPSSRQLPSPSLMRFQTTLQSSHPTKRLRMTTSTTSGAELSIGSADIGDADMMETDESTTTTCTTLSKPIHTCMFHTINRQCSDLSSASSSTNDGSTATDDSTMMTTYMYDYSYSRGCYTKKNHDDYWVHPF